jgi:hypothetical protein
MRKYALAVSLGLALTIVGLVRAEPVQSGPPTDGKVPGPFRPLHVTGPDAGARVCLYCKYGAAPVVMVFAREVSPAVLALLKQIDNVAVTRQDDGLRSCAIFLGEADRLSEPLRQAAASSGIRSTVLAIDAPAGPPSYRIAPEAAVTVLIYRQHTVKANHAFRSGELTEQGIAAVVADIGKVLPPR